MPNIKLDGHQSATKCRIGKPFARCFQEGTDNKCAKFRLNPMNRCGDIKYINLKSATLWSSPEILHRVSGAHGGVVAVEFNVIRPDHCGNIQHLLF